MDSNLSISLDLGFIRTDLYFYTWRCVTAASGGGGGWVWVYISLKSDALQEITADPRETQPEVRALFWCDVPVSESCQLCFIVATATGTWWEIKQSSSSRNSGALFSHGRVAFYFTTLTRA